LIFSYRVTGDNLFRKNPALVRRPEWTRAASNCHRNVSPQAKAWQKQGQRPRLIESSIVANTGSGEVETFGGLEMSIPRASSNRAPAVELRAAWER
jgi:hypothetical protein